MAIFRNVQMSFWTDADVIDEYTPEDKFFYLYLLTNPHTNLCGCYQISITQMASETGYDRKKITSLINRMVDVHKSICYSKETKEILVLKWSKYNWTESDKFRMALFKEIQYVKNEEFKQYLIDLYNGIDTVSIPYAYGMDTTVTDTVTDTVSVTDTDNDDNTDAVKDIVDHLNEKCGTKYKASTESTRRLIKARLKEGYTEQDFFDVIDKKAGEWMNTEQERYLRPETLFGNKFESYKNQKIRAPVPKKTDFQNFEQHDTDYDSLMVEQVKGRMSQHEG